MDNIAGTKSSLVWTVNLSVIALVLLWTIPTFGLLVSSFRDRDQIITSGWWNSLFSSQQNIIFRIGEPETQMPVGDAWAIGGSVFGEGSGEVKAFGITSREPEAFAPGDVADMGDGVNATVAVDGTYAVTSAVPFEGRSPRLFITSVTGGAARSSTRSIRAASRTATATASATSARASPSGSTTSPDLGVDAIWISAVLHLADEGLRLRRLRLPRRRSDVRHARGFRPLVAEAHARLKVIIDQVLSTPPTSTPGSRKAGQSRDNPKADWYVWADPKPDGTPPNNWLSIFGGSAWQWDTAARAVLPAQLPGQPAGPQLPQSGVQDARSTTCASGWSAASTASGSTRSTSTSTTAGCATTRRKPAERNGRGFGGETPTTTRTTLRQEPAREPRPSCKRLRALMDEYRPARRRRDRRSERSLQTMAAYTGRRRLHMCYTFDC
jgi:hypothetical protein